MSRVTAAEAELNLAKDQEAKARDQVATCRSELIAALAEEAGLHEGDKITVDLFWRKGPTRAFVERFGLQRQFGSTSHALIVYYRKAKKDGKPYAERAKYPTQEWTKGWDDAELD